MNGLMLNGALSRFQEACGQTAYEAGTKYLYHAGVTAGQYLLPGIDSPPREYVHEWNRSILYLHNSNASDSIVVFDRVNADDPRDPNTMSAASFSRFYQFIKDRINAADSKHQWIIHMPDANPVINGNTISWISEGGEKVTMKTFMQDYSIQKYD